MFAEMATHYGTIPVSKWYPLAPGGEYLWLNITASQDYEVV